jgi:Sec-independent protein translocase protein TatA
VNFFGIGNMELAFILIIATLVLGPARMVDIARNLGRFWGEAQRTLRAAADAATVKLDEPAPGQGGDEAGPGEPAPAQEPAPETAAGEPEAPAVSDEAPEGAVARGTGEEPPSSGAPEARERDDHAR